MMTRSGRFSSSPSRRDMSSPPDSKGTTNRRQPEEAGERPPHNGTRSSMHQKDHTPLADALWRRLRRAVAFQHPRSHHHMTPAEVPLHPRTAPRATGVIGSVLRSRVPVSPPWTFGKYGHQGAAE